MLIISYIYYSNIINYKIITINVVFQINTLYIYIYIYTYSKERAN